MTKRFSLLVLFLLVVSCSPASGNANVGGALDLGATLVSSQPASPTAAATEAPPATAVPVQEPPAPTPVPVQELPSPTMPPAPPTATIPPRLIEVHSPSQGATIRSPVRVSGFVSVSPFEATLRCRVYDASGQVVGEGPIMVASEMGQPGNFDGQVSFAARASGPQVVLPLRILARVGQPGQQVVAALRWQDGTELTHTFVTLQGEDGRGLLIDSLNWLNEGQPPQPPTQPATLDLRTLAGEVLARQDVTVLSLDDPGTQEILLPFVLGETVQTVPRRIPRTAGIGRATLEELLWGPFPPNLAGFGTALPTPQQVLAYPGRTPDWGPRVTLRQLTIVDGVATADFSKEMQAYGGGSLRVMLIRQQITQALMQFPTVQQVIIAVEGETEAVLQP
jgi:hypothetical protein